MSDTTLDEERSHPFLRWLPALVAAGAITVVGLGAGPTGVLVGVLGAAALLVARVRLATPYVFAIGQVALVAGLGRQSPGAGVWIAEIALLGVVLAPSLDTEGGRRLPGTTLAATTVLVAVAWGTHVAWTTTWATGVVLAGTGALMGYGLHRYEQVQLGVVRDV